MSTENKHNLNIFINIVIIMTIVYFLYKTNDLRFVLLSLPFFALITYSTSRIEIIKTNNVTTNLKLMIYIEKILFAVCFLILLVAQNNDYFGNLIYENNIVFLVIFAIIVMIVTFKKSKEKTKAMRLK